MDLDLAELAVGVDSQIDQLLQVGNVQAATYLAYAVLQTANQSAGTSTEDRIAVRFKVWHCAIAGVTLIARNSRLDTRCNACQNILVSGFGGVHAVESDNGLNTVHTVL